MTTPEVLHLACVQMTAGDQLDDNLDAAAALIREAASALPNNAARLITTPEMTSGIIKGRAAMMAAAHPQDRHPAIPFFQDLARELEANLLIGSLAIKPPPDDPDQRLYNRSVFFHETGELGATYDKINMFDVSVEGDQAYRESNAYRPGPNQPVTAALGAFTLGLTICYDLRFPALYRDLAKAGASVIAVPSAFTVPTGQAHWSVLLRARAIETGAYVIAPAQTGEHYKGRKTYGHSMIISPWGEVLAEAGDQPSIITATLDISLVAKARDAIPAWQQG